MNWHFKESILAGLPPGMSTKSHLALDVNKEMSPLVSLTAADAAVEKIASAAPKLLDVFMAHP